jgi:uncharacterized protein YkwD
MSPRAWGSLAAVFFALLVFAGSAAGSQGTPARSITAVNALEGGVLGEINALRARHGLAPLRLSTRLAGAADLHSRTMASGGFFRHESADGSAFWKRLQRFYFSKGFGYWSVGENLLWASPNVDPSKALKMWLDSPPHRKNLLAPQWREIGLSAVHAVAAPGAFEGMDVTILTADFGVRH